MKEFHQLFRAPLKLLKKLGFLSKYEISIKGKIWHGYALFMFLLIFVNTTFQAHAFVKSFEKLDKLIDNIGVFTQSLFLTLKLMSFYLQRETFHILMETLVKLTDESKCLNLLEYLMKNITRSF